MGLSTGSAAHSEQLLTSQNPRESLLKTKGDDCLMPGPVLREIPVTEAGAPYSLGLSGTGHPFSGGGRQCCPCSNG